tara:strand:+ start:255 stop:803 length:549 start_codon:yes stop_codon:yes gene_type:complete
MAGGIGGAIGGFKKIKQGKQMERAGQAGIDAFDWDDLKNPYKELQVSTAGAEMRTDQANLATATTMQAVRAGGTRSIVGASGKVQAQNNLVSRDIAAGLDEQQKGIDMKAAQDETQIRAMNEKRQGDELAGYGNMMDVGMDMKNSGMGDLVAAGGALDSLALSAVTGGFSSAMGGGNTESAA